MLYHCFASFKQSLLDFFKLVDSRLMLMLLYDSLNLIISGVHQSHLGCWGQVRKSEVERFGQCCVQDVPVRSLTERQIIIRNVFGSYSHSVKMVEHLNNAIH